MLPELYIDRAPLLDPSGPSESTDPINFPKMPKRSRTTKFDPNLTPNQALVCIDFSQSMPARHVCPTCVDGRPRRRRTARNGGTTASRESRRERGNNSNKRKKRLKIPTTLRALSSAYPARPFDSQPPQADNNPIYTNLDWFGPAGPCWACGFAASRPQSKPAPKDDDDDEAASLASAGVLASFISSCPCARRDRL